MSHVLDQTPNFLANHSKNNTGCVRLLSPFRESSSVCLDKADRICQLCEVQPAHNLPFSQIAWLWLLTYTWV